jgi:hypothetical protein
MNETVVIEVPKDLAETLNAIAGEKGISIAEAIRSGIGNGNGKKLKYPLRRYAGIVKDSPVDGSSRKGFSRD